MCVWRSLSSVDSWQPSQINAAQPSGRIPMQIAKCCKCMDSWVVLYNIVLSSNKHLSICINQHVGTNIHQCATLHKHMHSLPCRHFLYDFFRLLFLISIYLCAVYEWRYTSAVLYKRIRTKSTLISVVCLAANICFTLNIHLSEFT